MYYLKKFKINLKYIYIHIKTKLSELNQNAIETFSLQIFRRNSSKEHASMLSLDDRIQNYEKQSW